jgi:hypothetical protein
MYPLAYGERFMAAEAETVKSSATADTLTRIGQTIVRYGAC